MEERSIEMQAVRVAALERSAKAVVRNPILSLEAAQKIAALPEPAREALGELLNEIRADARVRAEKCWRTRKPPLAAYWQACSVYAGHIARLTRKSFNRAVFEEVAAEREALAAERLSLARENAALTSLVVEAARHREVPVALGQAWLARLGAVKAASARRAGEADEEDEPALASSTREMAAKGP